MVGIHHRLHTLEYVTLILDGKSLKQRTSIACVFICLFKGILFTKTLANGSIMQDFLYKISYKASQ